MKKLIKVHYDNESKAIARASLIQQGKITQNNSIISIDDEEIPSTHPKLKPRVSFMPVPLLSSRAGMGSDDESSYHPVGRVPRSSRFKSDSSPGLALTPHYLLNSQR